MSEAHLWTFNHNFTGIADQVEFLLDFFKGSGWELSISTKPRTDRHNILIENFQPNSTLPLRKFYNETGQRVSVVMTEHIDFKNKTVYFHGTPWSLKKKDNDYMEVGTQMNRLRTLMELTPMIRSFLTLGDIPTLSGLNEMFLGKQILRIPFPNIEYTNADISTEPKYDFVFSGAMTRYRSNILKALKNDGWEILVNERLASRNRRNALINSAKLVLNIPQNEDWRWISLMRVYSSLKANRATISLTKNDTSAISQCCEQFRFHADGQKEKLGSYLRNWRERYQIAHSQYHEMAFNYKKSTSEDVIKLQMLLD